MAGKQLGKWRQWAGEVISSRDKTVVAEEFRDLERDIELRRQGLWKLHVASEDFRNHITKKKECEAINESEKLLPIEALGIIMIKHGEEFGDDSVYGTSLMSLGRAHCKIATLQEAFGMDLQATYLASVIQIEDEIKEYQAQRKKLESRRLTLDAAWNKLEKIKSSKKQKEKDREEAEQEYAKALSRYEEISEDVRAKMHAIQENEIAQLRDLTGLLNLEFQFIESYLEVLRGVKDEWVDEETIIRMEQEAPIPRHKHTRSTASASGSLRSKSSIKRPKAKPPSETESSEDESTQTRALSSSKGAPEATSRTTSRAASPTSRKRSDSTATVGSMKDKSDKSHRRKSVAGWASNAVSSMTGRGKKDKEAFAALRDSDGEDSDPDDEPSFSRPASAMSSSSRKSQHQKGKDVVRPSSAPSRPSIRDRKSARDVFASSGEHKVVVALHDFAAGSTEELSFHAGDRITVVSEVLDGWWMGEVDGKRGLFPTTYTDVVSSISIPPRSALQRHSSASARALAHVTSSSLNNSPAPSFPGNAEIQGDTPSDSEEHPFGDHNVAVYNDPSHESADIRSPGIGQFWPDSASSAEEDDDEEQLVPTLRQSVYDDPVSVSYNPSLAVPPVLPRRSTTSDIKKPPPPPPPRRSPNIAAASLVNPPPLPSRPPSIPSRSSHSSSASLIAITNTPSLRGVSAKDDREDDGLTYSPFETPRDLGELCQDFRQNPFKPKGFCSNCHQMHT